MKHNPWKPDPAAIALPDRTEPTDRAAGDAATDAAADRGDARAPADRPAATALPALPDPTVARATVALGSLDVAETKIMQELVDWFERGLIAQGFAPPGGVLRALLCMSIEYQADCARRSAEAAAAADAGLPGEAPPVRMQ